MIAAVIIGVLLASTLAGWFVRRACRSAERSERDPRYRRGLFIRVGLIYTCGSIFAVTEVLRGAEPAVTLIGLPIGLGFIWFFFREAGKIKIPRS